MVQIDPPVILRLFSPALCRYETFFFVFNEADYAYAGLPSQFQVIYYLLLTLLSGLCLFLRVEKEKTQLACECDELATKVEDANRGKVSFVFQT